LRSSSASIRCSGPPLPVAQERITPDELYRDSIQDPGHPGLPDFLETDTRDGSQQIDAIEFVSQLPDRIQDWQRVFTLGPDEQRDIGGIPGKTAKAPAIRNSTPFEFKHSTNSRKPLLRGIGVGSIPDRKKNRDPLLGVHLASH